MNDNLLETLYNSLNQAIKDECNETITVAFSGGIDSTLVAFIANKYCNIELIAVGVPGSHDLEAAKSAAKLIGMEIKIIEVSENEIQEFCSKSLASFKVPEKIHFAEKLPRTATGKIQRRNVAKFFS